MFGKGGGLISAGDELMKIILAAYFIATPCWADQVPFQPGILDPVVRQHINVPEILTNCNDVFYQTPNSAEDEFKFVNKEIEKRVNEEHCYRVSPLTSISIRNKLLCTFNKRPNAKGFRRVKNALNKSLLRYYSLKKCQDSEEDGDIFEVDDNPVSTPPEETKPNEITVNRDDDLTENPKVNDYEPELEVVEVASTPKPANSPETEITTKGTTDSDKDSGDLNDGTDDQDNLPSKETLILAIVSTFILIGLLAFLMYCFKYRFRDSCNFCKSDPVSDLNESEMGTYTNVSLL